MSITLPTWKKSMNDRVMVDCDVILDLLCERQPFYPFAAQLFSLADTKMIRLVTSALAFANVFYILRKSLGSDQARLVLRKLRILLDVADMGEKTVDLALNSVFRDFEDALQYFTAREAGISILLTRNVRDYPEKEVIVMTPRAYLGTLEQV